MSPVIGKHPLHPVHKKERVSVVTNKLYKKGTYFGVLRGHYTRGPRQDADCVCKVLRSSDPYMASIFDSHYKRTVRIMRILDAFNDEKLFHLPVRLNRNSIVQLPEAAGARLEGCLAFIEPYVPDMVQFNSPSGWEAPSMPGGVAAAMQALSHFSFHMSGGGFLLCDLQGAVVDDEVVLCDPAVFSRTRQFGPRDLGEAAIQGYFKAHKCTSTCVDTWNLPRHLDTRVQPAFEVAEQSLMTTRDNRVLPIQPRK